MNSHDYFMRQIEDMAQFLAKTFFHKRTEEIALFDEQGMPYERGIMYGTIKAMTSDGKINEAENLLFERLAQLQEESENASEEIYPKMCMDAQRYLEVAVKFYGELNGLSDDRLFECGFSREEIFEGLSEVKNICEEMQRG